MQNIANNLREFNSYYTTIFELRIDFSLIFVKLSMKLLADFYLKYVLIIIFYCLNSAIYHILFTQDIFLVF